MLVTATEWGVATHTGSDIEGAILSVIKIVDEPNHWGGMGVVVRHPEHDGKGFETSVEASAYALSVGLLRPSER